MAKKRASTYKLQTEDMEKFELVCLHLKKDRQDIIEELVLKFLKKYDVNLDIKKRE